ncbi:MAG TPA: APC family permease [Steroidobacteraceae bacterium]|nr:APC family permease [Steroidobacteraceae bacterium]
MNTTAEPASLKRVVGVGALGFNAVNMTVASGIFALPALMAAALGSAAVSAYLVCIVLFGLVGLCFAEAGSRVGGAGGLYAYATTSFGPVLGGIAGNLAWIAGGAAADAAIINLLFDTLATVIPVLSQSWIRTLFMLGLFGVVAITNIRGVRYGVRLSVLMTLIKIAPLVALVIVGAFFIDPSQLKWTHVPAVSSIGAASVAAFYTFMGVEAALSMSGEVVRPARTVPRGILMGLLIIGAIYVGVQLVAQGTMGAALADSKTPLVDTARIVFGPWGGTFMVVALALSASGCIAGDLLSSPRVPFALAERSQLPRSLAYVHPRFGTPAVAIAAYAVVCAVLAISGSFELMLVLSSAGVLIVYLICCVGVLRLRAVKITHDAETFIARGGPLIPLAAAVIIIWMLWSLVLDAMHQHQWKEIFFAGGFVVLLAAAYYVLERRRNVSSHRP